MTATTIACDSRDATGLPRGDSRWLLVWRHGYSAFSSEREPPRGKPVASLAPHLGHVCSEREPPTGQARGILGSTPRPCVAATVNLQRGKPVASLAPHLGLV